MNAHNGGGRSYAVLTDAMQRRFGFRGAFGRQTGVGCRTFAYGFHFLFVFFFFLRSINAAHCPMANIILAKK